MHADGTFSVSDFAVSGTLSGVPAALPFADITMVKTFSGDVAGRSDTRFLGGIDQESSTGAYVAVEHFEGSINGKEGALVFVHMQTIKDGEITAMALAIVPGSGTGDLAGIHGDGGIRVDPDDTHHIWIDYELD